jgi:hypothetical protein
LSRARIALFCFAAGCRSSAPPPDEPQAPAAQAEPAAAPQLWFTDAREHGVPKGWIAENEALSATIAGQRVTSLVVGWNWPSNGVVIEKTYACELDLKDGDRVALERKFADAGYALERTPGAQSLRREGLSVSLSRVVPSLMIAFYQPPTDAMLPAAVASMPVPDSLRGLVSFASGQLRSASYGWIAPELHEMVFEGYVPVDTSALEAEIQKLGGEAQILDQDPDSREYGWTQDDWKIHVVLAPRSRDLAPATGKSVLTATLQRG